MKCALNALEECVRAEKNAVLMNLLRAVLQLRKGELDVKISLTCKLRQADGT